MFGYYRLPVMEPGLGPRRMYIISPIGPIMMTPAPSIYRYMINPNPGESSRAMERQDRLVRDGFTAPSALNQMREEIAALRVWAESELLHSGAEQ